MASLIEIRHADDFAAGSPQIERTAARAVITHDGELLLLRSRHGDYKFPGGGVEVDESAQGAVTRELREECGLLDVTVGELVCTTVELSHAREAGAVFKMTSLYFECATGDTPGAQILDDYERDLVLTPTWVSAAKAREVNEELLQTRRDDPDLPWLLRETQVLQWLEKVTPVTTPDTTHDERGTDAPGDRPSTASTVT